MKKRLIPALSYFNSRTTPVSSPVAFWYSLLICCLSSLERLSCRPLPPPACMALMFCDSFRLWPMAGGFMAACVRPFSCALAVPTPPHGSSPSRPPKYMAFPAASAKWPSPAFQTSAWWAAMPQRITPFGPGKLPATCGLPYVCFAASTDFASLTAFRFSLH